MSDPFRIDGKRALVTGANSGIGQAIAEGLAAAGAHVICAGRSSCAETLAHITDAGGSAEELHMELVDLVKAAGLLAGISPLDILVNNAGTIRRGPAEHHSEQDWDDVIDINLKAVFMLSQAFARSALERNAPAKIVNIASMLSFQGGIHVGAYTAAKHGVAGLTKLCANEWAGRGINTNAVAPGYIATKNTKALQEDVARSAEILGRIPAGRWGRPQDIAGAVVFLASPAADYVNGAVLNVDGGWLAR